MPDGIATFAPDTPDAPPTYDPNVMATPQPYNSDSPIYLTDPTSTPIPVPAPVATVKSSELTAGFTATNWVWAGFWTILVVLFIATIVVSFLRRPK